MVLHSDTPISIILTLSNSAHVPVYKTVATLDRCNSGKMTSNLSGPVAAPAPASVPTLGEGSLVLLGLGAAGLAAPRLRRRSS